MGSEHDKQLFDSGPSHVEQFILHPLSLLVYYFIVLFCFILFEKKKKKEKKERKGNQNKYHLQYNH